MKKLDYANLTVCPTPPIGPDAPMLLWCAMHECCQDRHTRIERERRRMYMRTQPVHSWPVRLVVSWLADMAICCRCTLGSRK